MLGKFRLKKETLGIVAATRIVQPVPEGAIIEIPRRPPDGVRLANILWNGQRMMMFVQDLIDRGEPVD